MLEQDNVENELSSFFKAYWSPVDQYIHLPPRVSEGAGCECCVLNFTLGIWRISFGKLFQILTPFLEKDMFCLSNLEYRRKKLPLVDDSCVVWMNIMLVIK